MKTLCQRIRKAGAVLAALAVLVGLFPPYACAGGSETAPAPEVTFTFSDSGIIPSNTAASGYTIKGTTLTISAAGTYGVTGSCSEGNIVVKASTTGVTLLMEDLTLSCSTSAPLLCKKASGVTLWLSGESVLTDGEDPANETSSDESVADAFEGAAIKVNKDGAALLIKGSGKLTADGGACKNGIKAGAGSTITVSGGELVINAANNALAADGAVVIQGGVLDIDADNDGIKSSPDDGDTVSAGTVTIYGGDIAINAGSDGINAAGDIAIYGGALTIHAQSDGIQTDSNLTISGGTFDIQTLSGYNSASFDSDTMSCKGLKASASDDDTDSADNTITISGGTFALNTADDAIHSDAYIEITGGKFDIQTGDDGVHADTSLILGTEGGTVARDPDMTIRNSYEGLEAGTVYIYAGRYYVCASDDGINAAGGSGNGGNPGGPGDHFNPGGGFPGGGGPGGRPMSLMGAGGGQSSDAGLLDASYSLNIAGGEIYVDAEGDGLDSNGPLTLSGGSVTVWGPRAGTANAALDADGTIFIRGASVFAAGSSAMIENPSSASQSVYSRSANISAGALVTVKDSSGATVFNDTAANRAVNYVIYSTPDMASSSGYTVSVGSGSVSCSASHSWNHSWDDGTVTTAATTTAAGVRTYTCSVCGATETETIPMLAAIPDDSGGNTCTVSGTSADVALDFSEYGVSTGTYLLIVGFYASDGRFLGGDTRTVAIDAELSTEAEGLLCPSDFDGCTAFLLHVPDNTPACEQITLAVVSKS